MKLAMNALAAALISSMLGCGSASDGLEARAERRICDGSSEVRLAIGYGTGGMVLPFSSVLYELGIDFLFVDGNCHYWTQQPISVVDEYYAWRPYREGVLTADQERQLHESVDYVDFAAQECASYTATIHASPGFLWDGTDLYSCFEWNIPSIWPLRGELYDAGTDVTGSMRLQVGRASIHERQVVYEWPLEASIDQYLIDDGETRSFLVDDAAAVTALRALREQAVVDAAAAPGYFSGLIAIAPREGDGSYVMALRDELPFVDAQGSWLPARTTSAAGDDE